MSYRKDLVLPEQKHDFTKGTLTVTHKSKDGVIKEHRELPMKSFLENWIRYWRYSFDDYNGDLPLRTTGANMTLSRFLWQTTDPDEPSPVDRLGVQVGSSSTAVTFQDVDLGTRIANGTAAGELEYANPGCVQDAGTRTVALSRTFSNNSGGNVTVRELGLRFSSYFNSLSSASYEGYFVRDVIADIVLADGDILSVVYDFDFSDFNDNGYEMFAFFLDDDSSRVVTQKDGGNETITSSARNQYAVRSTTNNFGRGLFVGTDSTANTGSETNLGGYISPGNGDNLLQYGACTVSAISEDAGTQTFTISRTVTNNGSVTIGVNEVGLFGDNVGNLNDMKLFFREVLPTTVNIAAGASQTFTIPFKITL